MALTAPAKVGILTLAALIALGTIIVWKTEIFMVRRGYELIGSFESVEGLTIGSEVRYRGLKVGKVQSIDPGPHDIKVYAVIERNIKFPEDSSLRVSYDGIVGLKFLEIRPGTSQVLYASPKVLYGIKTAGIVDFVDIGSQNLEETKRIMENIRIIVENPELQESILRTVVTADRVSANLEKLTAEIRQTNQGIRDVVADPKFQENVKGTISETKKTLTTANNFFESVGKVNLRATAGVDIGSRFNSVRGNVDVVQAERNYISFGMGEGPARQLSLLDVLFVGRLSETVGYRLGVISRQIGVGLALYPTEGMTIRGDVYDINNPRPNLPKVRFGFEHQLMEYMDLVLKSDDTFNHETRNVSFGIMVKPSGERIY